jgi:hypothetical protein
VDASTVAKGVVEIATQAETAVAAAGYDYDAMRADGLTDAKIKDALGSNVWPSTSINTN